MSDRLMSLLQFLIIGSHGGFLYREGRQLDLRPWVYDAIKDFREKHGLSREPRRGERFIPRELERQLGYETASEDEAWAEKFSAGSDEEAD